MKTGKSLHNHYMLDCRKCKKTAARGPHDGLQRRQMNYRSFEDQMNREAILADMKEIMINPITYGFLARTIRLLPITQKRLNLAPPTFVSFIFYLLGTFRQNFNKMNSLGGGGLLQLFLK